MKKYKTLIIYYLISILLSIICLFSYNKGSDFLTAISSVTSELSLIVSIILIIYALLFCSSYIKDENMSRKSMITSIIILSLTTIAIFVSFINIFSHRNVFDYALRVINKKESLDIVKLFAKFLSVYLYIFTFAIIGLLLYHYYNKNKKFESAMLVMLLITLIYILINVTFKNIRTIIAIDTILYLLFLTIEKEKLK